MLVGLRTQLAHALRCQPAEHGIIAGRGVSTVVRRAAMFEKAEVPAVVKDMFEPHVS